MRIIKVEKSEHYILFHEQNTPWIELVDMIFASKSKRKVGDKIKIINNRYYVLGKFENGTFIVINAKRK